MSKLAYPDTTYSKTEADHRDRIFKENRDHRIRHLNQAPIIEKNKLEMKGKEVRQKYQAEYLRYSKYSVGGHKGKPNQDRIFCGENTYIICDGHGP